MFTSSEPRTKPSISSRSMRLGSQLSMASKLNSDRGGEYLLKEFSDHLKSTYVNYTVMTNTSD